MGAVDVLHEDGLPGGRCSSEGDLVARDGVIRRQVLLCAVQRGGQGHVVRLARGRFVVSQRPVDFVVLEVPVMLPIHPLGVVGRAVGSVADLQELGVVGDRVLCERCRPADHGLSGHRGQVDAERARDEVGVGQGERFRCTIALGQELLRFDRDPKVVVHAGLHDGDGLVGIGVGGRLLTGHVIENLVAQRVVGDQGKLVPFIAPRADELVELVVKVSREGLPLGRVGLGVCLKVGDDLRRQEDIGRVCRQQLLRLELFEAGPGRAPVAAGIFRTSASCETESAGRSWKCPRSNRAEAYVPLSVSLRNSRWSATWHRLFFGKAITEPAPGREIHDP